MQVFNTDNVTGCEMSLGGNKNKFTNVGSHLPIYYTGKSETAGQLLKYQNKIKKRGSHG
jgi:hypothetical protein